MSDKTYSVAYVCLNCGHKFTKAIPKGQTANERECPRCGCWKAQPARVEWRS